MKRSGYANPPTCRGWSTPVHKRSATADRRRYRSRRRFPDAYDLGALAFGMKDVAREFNLTPAGSGMVASAITFGAIVGALIGGWLTDKIGRYRVFMADMFFFVVAALACALAPNEYVLAGARFVMGLGVGIDLPVAMAFLAEFSRLKGRGNKAASIAMWCPTVCRHQRLLSAGAGALQHTAVEPRRLAVAPDSGLRRGAALAIIAIRSRYMSESPVWAANQGDLHGAAAILRRARGINAQVASDADLSAATRTRRPGWRNYGALLRGVYLRRTLLATVISIASSFAYNAVAFGLPVIISSFPAQTMLTTILVSLALNLLFAFVGGLLAVRLVPRPGAWRMTVAGYACQLAALLGLALIGRPQGMSEAMLAIAMLALFLFGRVSVPVRTP